MWLKRFLPNYITMTFNKFLCDHKPLVVVLGATGTGKSKLALEIAKKYNGEVISADSMQVYKGLDIITNKVTAEERQVAPHHLLDFVDPLQDFHIQQFRDLAVSAIKQLHDESKLPVVVGGTHYYIESVLWKVLVSGATKEAAASDSSSQSNFDLINCLFSGGNSFSETSYDRTSDASKRYVQSSFSQSNPSSNTSDTKHTVDQNNVCDNSKTSFENNSCPNQEREGKDFAPVSLRNNPEVLFEPQTLLNSTREVPYATEDLYEKLCAIDPDRAKMLHPKDRRKIIRSLQVWQQTGEKHSVHIRRQREEAGGNVLGGGLRYPNTVVFWLHSDQAVLDTRLDARVDDMLQNGLLTELLDFHEHYNKARLRFAATSVGASPVGEVICISESNLDPPRGSSCALLTSCRNLVHLSSGDPLLTGTSSTSSNQDGISNKADMNSEHLKKKLDEPNALEDTKVHSSSSSPCSVTGDTADLVAGQKHPASCDENTRNKRLKLDADCITHPLSMSAEEAAKPVSSSAVMDEHPNNIGGNIGKECHGGSEPSVSVQPNQAGYSQGIFQSIGFKEFHEYLVLPPEERNSERGEKLRQSGIELMKLATRRYARRQFKWIKNRFTKDLERPVPPIYRLDVTDPADWNAAVSVPADAVVQALVAGHPPPHHVIKPVDKIPAPLSEIQGRFDRHECTLCSRVFIGRDQWRAHVRGAKHKKMKQRRAAALREQEQAAIGADLAQEERTSMEKNVVMPLEESQVNEDCSEKEVCQQ